MTCVIKTKNPVITREGNLWVIDGKTKVADLSECKFVHASKEEAPSVGNTEPVEVPVVAVTPQTYQPVSVPQQQPMVQQPMVQQNTQGGDLDLVQVVRLAGDNVWLAIVLVVGFLGKKYLEKMDIAQATYGTLKGEIETLSNNASKQLDTLSTQQDGLSKKLDAVQSKTDALQSKVDTDLSNLEKKLYAVEMELKYSTKSSPSSSASTSAKGGKKTATTTEEE